MAEHLTFNQGVRSSNLRWLTTKETPKSLILQAFRGSFLFFGILYAGNEKERAIFTKQEIAFLRQHDTDERSRIILTLIYTGFRPNELFSVTLDNVNLTKGYIIGGSKTEAGMNRKVPIHPIIKPYIEDWYTKGTTSVKVVSLNRFLITNQSGGKMDLKNFRFRQFYPLLLGLGILELPKGQKAYSKEYPPRLTPYCTRHTFASLASAAGIKPEVLQEIMGHEDYSTAVNYYEHFEIDEPQKEFDKLKA